MNILSFLSGFLGVSWVPSQIEHLANQLVGTRSQSATLLQRSSGPSSSCQAGLQLPTREAQVICISWGGAETGLQGHWGSYANISSYQCKAGESQMGKRTHWQEIWVCYVWFWIFAIEAKLDAKLECKSITWQHHPKGHKQQQQQQRTYNKPQLKHLCTLNNLVQRCSKCAQGEVDHEKNQNRIGNDSPACGNPAGIEWN